MAEPMTETEVQALQASQRHKTIVNNAGIIRLQVRGLSKVERLERYDHLRWGFWSPLMLAAEGALAKATQ